MVRLLSLHPKLNKYFQLGELTIFGVLYKYKSNNENSPATGKISRDGYFLDEKNVETFDPTFMNSTW